MLNILVRGQKLYLVNNILWEEHPAKPQGSFPTRLHLIAFGFIQSRIIEVKLPRMLLNQWEEKKMHHVSTITSIQTWPLLLS